MTDEITEERLREIIEGTYCGFDEGAVIAAKLLAANAEAERLRADLREAMELLRAHGHPPDWLKLGEAANWNTRYGKLLAKHKETNQ